MVRLGWLLVVWAGAAGCKSKLETCLDLQPRLDAVTERVDRLLGLTSEGVRIGDPENCARFGRLAAGLSAVSPELEAMAPDDEALREQLKSYRAHVDVVARSARQIEAACDEEDLEASRAPHERLIHHSLRVPFVIAEIRRYCER